jgi:hypothetical protein
MEICELYRFIHIVLPFLFVFSFARSIPHRGFAWIFLAGVASYQVCVFVLTMALGHLEMLRAPIYRTGFLTLFFVTTLLSLRGLPALGKSLLAIRYQPRGVDLLIGAAIAVTALLFYLQWVNDWSKGPSHFDSVGYHITRALIWFDQESFSPWRTANWTHIGLPLGGDAKLQPIIFLGCGWLGAAWVGMVETIGAAVAIYLIQIAYGINGRGALLGSLAFLSFPTVVLRINEVNTDMAAAFPVLAAAAFFLHSQSLSKGLFVFLVMTGLGVAAKGYVLFAAIPISVALFAPRIRTILRTPGVWWSSFFGSALALIFFLLSYTPIYEAFGDFHGGRIGLMLSSFGHPLSDAAWTTLRLAVTWIFEPLMVVPNDERQAVFEYIKLKELYTWMELTPRWFPQLHSGENRTGVFPLILLPWLIMAVKPGYRALTLLFLVALFCSVTSPMSLNLGAARFALLSSAFFAILWGLRGTRNTTAVALLALTSCLISLKHLKPEKMKSWLPAYSEDTEQYRKVGEAMDGQSLLIFSRGLATEAFASGRHGRWRFAYIDCPPPDMSYRDWLISLKQRSKWIGVNLDTPSSRFGPQYVSRLGPICPEITSERLRQELEDAGWRYYTNVSYTEQVWRAN